MTDYLLGIGWLIFSTLICYGLGAAIRRQTASFAQNLVVGYLAYSFILAMLIVPIQLLARSFAPLVIAVVAAGRRGWTDRDAVAGTVGGSSEGQRAAQKQLFLVIVVVALMGIYLLQTDLIWNNNNTDDGYYLVKSATLAYLADPFTPLYGTSSTTHLQFGPIQTSSIQAEMSVYIYLLGIDPVFFMRGVLNVFHYLLVAASVSVRRGNLHIHRSENAAFLATVFGGSRFCCLPSVSHGKRGTLLRPRIYGTLTARYGTGEASCERRIPLDSHAFHCNRGELVCVGLTTVSAISVVLISKAAAAIPLILVAGIGYLLALR